MTFEARIMCDFRKRKEHGKAPALTEDTVVLCGGWDWKGKIKDTAKDGGERKCPKCGNFIFAFNPLDYTFRIREGT